MSLTYTDCKELKDNGFPQGNAQWIYPDGSECGIPADRDENDTTICYVPSLSELIEACGERFEALVVDNWTGNILNGIRKPKEGWIACNRHIVLDGEPDAIIGKGSSPEQAVARLWIALQKQEEQDSYAEHAREMGDLGVIIT